MQNVHTFCKYYYFTTVVLILFTNMIISNHNPFTNFVVLLFDDKSDFFKKLFLTDELGLKKKNCNMMTNIENNFDYFNTFSMSTAPIGVSNTQHVWHLKHWVFIAYIHVCFSACPFIWFLSQTYLNVFYWTFSCVVIWVSRQLVFYEEVFCGIILFFF